MKVLIKEYEVKNPTIKKTYKFINISDIHSSYFYIDGMLDIIKEINPEFIIISGDTIDTVNCPFNDKLIDSLVKLSKIAHIYLSYGNHEMLSKPVHKNKKNKYIKNDDFSFFDELLSKTNNITILGFNGTVEYNDDLTIKGYAIDNIDWYETGESRTYFENDFKSKYQPANNFTILSSHSPNSYVGKKGNLMDKYTDILTNTLIVSGHNHGGFVPHGMQKALNKTPLKGVGVAGPYNKLFFTNAYGYFTHDCTSLIISDGITKWSECHGVKMGKMVNSVLIPSFDVITLSNGKEHSLKYLKSQKKKIN